MMGRLFVIRLASEDGVGEWEGVGGGDGAVAVPNMWALRLRDSTGRVGVMKDVIVDKVISLVWTMAKAACWR